MTLRRAVAVVVFILAGPGLASAASLSELQKQLSQAQSELDKYQTLQRQEKTKSDQYAKNIADTQAQINSVQATISSLESQINQKETGITQTNQKIAAKTTELNDLTNQLNQSLGSYYELTHLLAVETLAADASISHLNDRSEYLQSLQNHSLATIDALEKVRADLQSERTDLESQKNQLAALKGEQEDKNRTLTAQKQRVSALLAAARKNEAEYRAKAQRLQSENARLSQEIYRLRAAQSGRGGEKYIPATSDYPWASENPNLIDPWDFYFRQCTSYAAFKWYRVYGFSFRNSYAETGVGHASYWPSIARSKGYTVTSAPRAPSVVSWPAGPVIGPYGHTAWVERVNPDGTIDVSEYNFIRLSFSYRKGVRYQDYGPASFITP